MVTNPIFCTFRKQQATILLGVIANIFTSVIIYVITIKLLETKDIYYCFPVEAILHVLYMSVNISQKENNMGTKYL